jgi:hypothetical protein
LSIVLRLRYPRGTGFLAVLRTWRSRQPVKNTAKMAVSRVTSLATATVHNKTFMLPAVIRRRRLQFSECSVEKQPTYLSYLRKQVSRNKKTRLDSRLRGNDKQQTNLFYRAFSEKIRPYRKRLIIPFLSTVGNISIYLF